MNIYFGGVSKNPNVGFAGYKPIIYNFWMADSPANPYLKDATHSLVYQEIKKILSTLSQNLNFKVSESQECQCCIDFTETGIDKNQQILTLIQIVDELKKNGCIYSDSFISVNNDFDLTTIDKKLGL